MVRSSEDFSEIALCDFERLSNVSGFTTGPNDGPSVPAADNRIAPTDCCR